jgi:hypothetical protein
MHRCSHFAVFVLLPVCLTVSQANAQTPARPQVSPNAQDQLTPQILGEMLRSATTFHELVTNLNLNRSLGPDQHVQGPDGQLHHPLERTAATLGAGAGVGAAVGAMSKSPNGVLIGALVGSAGGLIIDSIVKHREEQKAAQYATPDPGYVDHSRQLKRRDPDPQQK